MQAKGRMASWQYLPCGFISGYECMVMHASMVGGLQTRSVDGKSKAWRYSKILRVPCAAYTPDGRPNTPELLPHASNLATLSLVNHGKAPVTYNTLHAMTCAASLAALLQAISPFLPSFAGIPWSIDVLRQRSNR